MQSTEGKTLTESSNKFDSGFEKLELVYWEGEKL